MLGLHSRCRDQATGWPVQGSNCGSQRFFSRNRRHRVWDTHSLLFNGYRVSFRGRSVLLTAHVYLAPKLIMSGAIPLLSLCSFVECQGYISFPSLFSTGEIRKHGANIGTHGWNTSGSLWAVPSVVLTRKQQTSCYSLFSKMLTSNIFCSCVYVRKHLILAGMATSVSVPDELVYVTYPTFSVIR